MYGSASLASIQWAELGTANWFSIIQSIEALDKNKEGQICSLCDLRYPSSLALRHSSSQLSGIQTQTVSHSIFPSHDCSSSFLRIPGSQGSSYRKQSLDLLASVTPWDNIHSISILSVVMFEYLASSLLWSTPHNTQRQVKHESQPFDSPKPWTHLVSCDFCTTMRHQK